MTRKYLPTLSELIDRLSIVQLKEVFINEHKSEYSQEISDIVHDIQTILDSNQGKVDSETIRAIVVLSQMNLHIWHNESNYRKGIKDGTYTLILFANSILLKFAVDSPTLNALPLHVS